jgi:hypothetical protein
MNMTGMRVAINLAYIENCRQSTATLKKAQSDITQQIQPRKAGNALLKYEYELRKKDGDREIHESAENEYEHADKLGQFLSSKFSAGRSQDIQR